MVSLTRRRVLQGATGLLAGLAGCGGDDFDGPTEAPLPGRDRGTFERDPTHVIARASDRDHGDPIAEFVPDAADRGTDGGTLPEYGRRSQGFIAGEAAAETLSVVDGVTAETRTDDGIEQLSAGAAAVRRLVAETDFDRETVYFEQRSVRECHRLVLCAVSWTDREVETYYGRFLREHDVVCSTDAHDAVATFVRIPAALDPDTVESSGSATGNGHCHVPPLEEIRAATATDTTANGTETATDTAAAPQTATEGGSE